MRTLSGKPFGIEKTTSDTGFVQEFEKQIQGVFKGFSSSKNKKSLRSFTLIGLSGYLISSEKVQ